jgi:P27 family predicted phage terminase small subunit
MSRGQRPTATVLKLIRGDAHPERHRDDRPKINALPLLPPGAQLSADERAMWDWCMENIVVPGVHGTSDGGAFVAICRLWVRANVADEKIKKYGAIMRGQDNRPMLQPYMRVSRDCWAQLRIALADIGATPAGRFKISGPRVKGSPGDSASWEEID